MLLSAALLRPAKATKWTAFAFWYALALLLLAGPLLAADSLSCKLVSGWTQEGAPRSFVADNLFEYMDGNAEGYLIYNFMKMNGVTCKAGVVTLVFDISEMADPESVPSRGIARTEPRSAGPAL